MTELRDLLEETIMNNEPPVHTTTDDIVDDGRRRRSRRQWGIAGITGVAVVAAGLVTALTVGLPGFADADTDTDTTTKAPAGDDGPVTPDLVDPTMVPSDWQEYSQVVLALFNQHNPDLVYNGDSGREPFELDEWNTYNPGDPDKVYEMPHTGYAFLDGPDGQKVGSAEVILYEPGPWSTDPAQDEYAITVDGSAVFDDGPIVSCWEGVESYMDENSDGSFTERNHVTTTDCEETTTSSGDKMILIHKESGYEDEAPDTYRNSVVIFRSDDTAVVVGSMCGTADEDDPYGGTCQDLQFDLDQLAAIAEALPDVIVTDDGH